MQKLSEIVGTMKCKDGVRLATCIAAPTNLIILSSLQGYFVPKWALEICEIRNVSTAGQRQSINCKAEGHDLGCFVGACSSLLHVSSICQLNGLTLTLFTLFIMHFKLIS